MRKGIQKLMVSFVAVITLGFITPSHDIWDAVFDTGNDTKSQIARAAEATQTEIVTQIEEPELHTVDFTSLAKEQAYAKFGSKIGPKIEDDFETMIFPKIEQAIEHTTSRVGEQQLRNLAVTENPSGNYSEKIFDIYNRETKEDIIRFHVRTENRPFDGYYYNFHYHTYEDNFASHYDLGEIYWSRNTPPKWLS